MSGLKEVLRRRLPLLLIVAVVILGAVLVLLRQGATQTRLTPYIAQITIKGTIDYASSSIFGATPGVEEYIKLVKQAEEDPMAKAVLLVFDSPGGTVTASDELYQAVKELSQKKVVVSYAKGLLASGAYMAALPSRAILASPTSEVGSVGVIVTVLNVGNLLGKIGVTVYTFKSGELKDVGSPYRPMTEEDAKVLEEMVNYYFGLFKGRVLEHRGNVSSEVFSGRPFTPDKALQAGLIDKVCTYQEAVNYTRALANLPETAEVVELKPRTPTLLDLLLGTYSGAGNRLVIPSIVVLYMWPPPVAVILP
ncbi:signal peptide peptidase SppA [Thermofilum pendens]|uniref:Signal peptide peptidase SppA, 36K type n=1 Tax=Thermofilum pendens (strain DSM 2475 / Hrk 5) TaxID=368408 RepID=A1S190_THEPD|nr:signal peptide peptidase SppA [Thermofilum pendens]ABL79220.1 signal peptide peptidase SppA, 36K type [Thermofilum pendens Hrk 5]